MLQVEYGLKAPVCLGTTNMLEKNSVPPEEGSVAPLARSSSTSFWITGWWAAAALTLKHRKSWNKGGWDLSWRWWPQTIWSTNLLDVMLFHWSKNLKSIPTWKVANVDDEEDEEVEGSGTSRVPTPMPPFSWLSRTGGDTATSRLLATWMSLIPTLQVRPLRQRCPTCPWHRPWHRSLLYCELEPSLWCGLATPHRRKRL